MRRTFSSALVLGLGLIASASHAQAVRVEKNMSLELANQIAAQSVAACAADGYAVTATVVDRAGTVRAVQRADNAGPHTLEGSRLKAFTSASAKNNTLAMMEGAQRTPVPPIWCISRATCCWVVACPSRPVTKSSAPWALPAPPAATWTSAARLRWPRCKAC
jgi:hypothetical protein